MKRNQFVAVAATAVLVVGAVTGVWALGQREPEKQRTVSTPTFGPTGSEPAYIVVNTPTPVLFTSQITDPQLKKRSVVLIRLDASGKPFDIIGRLRDDGRNGDLKANDNIYSLRVTLNESATGQVGFSVAARFKPGQWREPEQDDDDWDKELSLFGQTTRDSPAKQQHRGRMLSRLARYTLSAVAQVIVGPLPLQATTTAMGFEVSYPSEWQITPLHPELDPPSANGVYAVDPTDEYPGQGIATVLDRNTSVAQIANTLSIGALIQQYTTLSGGAEWSVFIYDSSAEPVRNIVALSQRGPDVVRLGSSYSDLNLSIMTAMMSLLK